MREQVERNMALVRMRLARPDLTFEAIATEFEISKRHAINIWQEWSDAGQSELASADQTEILNEQIQGLRLLRGELYETFCDAGENYAAKVGALKAIADLRDKEISLLQSAGRLPKNLGSLEVLLNIRHTTEVFVRWGDKWVLDKLPKKERAEAMAELADVLEEALPKRGGLAMLTDGS